MRIAITGAIGSVGRAVVERAIAEGHTVVSIDQARTSLAEAEHLQVDLTDYAATERAFSGSDAVIHLAAINGPGRHPDHVVHDNNVLASYHVLRAAAELGISRVCQASSVNAIGGRFSVSPRFDYFPVDEQHPAYVEDAYSLSKSICELQAGAIARRHGITIASLRLHGVVGDRDETARWSELIGTGVVRQLWGYTRRDAAARAFLLAVTAAFDGHEAFNIVAPDTMVETPSSELAATWYPDVPHRSELPGNRGFYDCGKAQALLGWTHDGE